MSHLAANSAGAQQHQPKLLCFTNSSIIIETEKKSTVWLCAAQHAAHGELCPGLLAKQF